MDGTHCGLRRKSRSLFPINNNPSPGRRTIHPTRFGRSPLALSKVYIFPQENQYFAFPSHIQTLFCFQKCAFSCRKMNIFRFQCICTLSFPTHLRCQKYTFSCRKVDILRPQATSRHSSVSKKGRLEPPVCHHTLPYCDAPSEGWILMEYATRSAPVHPDLDGH